MQQPLLDQQALTLRQAIPRWGASIRQPDANTGERFSFWRYSLVVLVAAVILAARDPEKLWQPRFIAEDGAIFAQAYNLSTWAALTTPYAGYYHLLPRLVAEIGMGLPLAAIPLFYSMISLLLTSVALTWFVLPHFRYLIRSDLIRLAFVLLILLMPAVAALMQLAYIQWYLAVWALYVVLMPPLKSTWQQWAIALFYALVIFTAPIVVVCLPIWLLRLHFAWRHSGKAWIGLIVVAQLLSLLAIWRLPGQEVTAHYSSFLFALDLLHGFLHQTIVLPLLGYQFSAALFSYLGWPGYYSIGLIGLGLALYAWHDQQTPQKKSTSLWLIYVMVVAATFYLKRAAFFKFMFAYSLEGMDRLAARYFCISSVTFILLLFIQASEWIERKQTPLRWGVCISVYLLIVIGYSLALRMHPWGEAPWQPYAQLLTTIQASQKQPERNTLKPIANGNPTQTLVPAQTVVLHIPIAPEGWTMSLALPPTPACYTFPEGPTLLSINYRVKLGFLYIDLDWQGETQVAPGVNQFYTAYVHLLDQQHSRLAGTDVLLAQATAKADKPATPFQSHHVIELPVNLAAGRYDLAVGLYHFEHDQLVPGHGVIAEQRIVIPSYE
jgi:hypothetical protein